ncbi:MAG: hypothetical protein LBR07_09125 [Puniceicoccales bacterium]|jgi:TrmH family RNA methyltransferase|nr:hypothetical protein [Puniceicoccales bacterium]
MTETTAEVITSRQNPRVLALARLRERAGRREQGRFLIEGARELSRALAASVSAGTAGAAGAGAGSTAGGHPAVAVREVFHCPALFKDAAGATRVLNAARAAGASLVELGESAFGKVSGREGADGLLGVADTWDVSLAALGEIAPSALLLVVEAVEKPGNLGALFRTADSAGCAALLVADAVADIFNPNVVRASQGALFSMPCAVAPAVEIAAFLARWGGRVFAAAPAARRRYWDADFRGGAAVLLGGEKDGLSPLWLGAGGDDASTGGATGGAAAGVRVEPVSIPQAGLSDSLNVGVAGAVLLFEAVRQRATTGGVR